MNVFHCREVYRPEDLKIGRREIESNPLSNKPAGALWVSPLLSRRRVSDQRAYLSIPPMGMTSRWLEGIGKGYAAEGHTAVVLDCSKLTTLTVRCADDIETLPKKPCGALTVVDWPELARSFDAVRVTGEALSYPLFNRWDVDSTAIFDDTKVVLSRMCRVFFDRGDPTPYLETLWIHEVRP